jgi:hypothetical protein
MLSDGRLVEELDVNRPRWVNARCPEKWMLINLETGEQYTSDENNAEKINAIKWKKVDY